VGCDSVLIDFVFVVAGRIQAELQETGRVYFMWCINTVLFVMTKGIWDVRSTAPTVSTYNLNRPSGTTGLLSLPWKIMVKLVMCAYMKIAF